MLMLCSLCAISAGAEDDGANDLTAKCRDAFADYIGYEASLDEALHCKVFGNVSNNSEESSVMFLGYTRINGAAYIDVCSQQRIGGYLFLSGYVYGPVTNPVGLYVLHNGDQVIPLITAYELGYVDIDKAAQLGGAEAVSGTQDYRDEVISKISAEKDNYTELYAHYYQPNSCSAYDPDWVLVEAYVHGHEGWEVSKRIGDYAVSNSNLYSPDDLGYYIYVPAMDELYTLSEALSSENVIDAEVAFAHMGSRAVRIGDADGTGELNVRDATAIQKHLVGIDTPVTFGEKHTKHIFDFNQDDSVNVKDATAVQKFIAGFEVI